jgi:hypothetical protein
VQVRPQFRQAHRGVNRPAVVHDVQTGIGKIHDFAASGIFDVRIANVPFLRNCPVENASAGCHFVHFQTDLPADSP